MVDERDKIRAKRGATGAFTELPKSTGTPFGQAGSGTPSTVTGSAADQYGAQTKTVTITANTDPQQTLLRIKGTVDKPAA